MRKAILVSALVGVVGLTVSSAWAQNKKEEPKKDAGHSQPAPVKKDDKATATPAKPEAAKPAAATPPGMDPKMMEAMMAAATPNENHKALEGMAGEWTTTSKFWMAPGAPPSEGTGSCKSAMIFGGRQLHTTFNGDFGGMPFEGAGTTGYNNVSKQFEATWSDNMSTCTMFSVGTSDAARKVITLNGSYDDPINGKTMMRQVTTLTDKDHYSMEFYNKGSDGKEFKSGEIHFTRKAAGKSTPAAPAKVEPAKKDAPAPAKK